MGLPTAVARFGGTSFMLGTVAGRFRCRSRLLRFGLPSHEKKRATKKEEYTDEYKS
jgi:hypothetical protein